jgi:hypothetical protein
MLKDIFDRIHRSVMVDGLDVNEPVMIINDTLRTTDYEYRNEIVLNVFEMMVMLSNDLLSSGFNLLYDNRQMRNFHILCDEINIPELTFFKEIRNFFKIKNRMGTPDELLVHMLDVLIDNEEMYSDFLVYTFCQRILVDYVINGSDELLEKYQRVLLGGASW